MEMGMDAIRMVKGGRWRWGGRGGRGGRRATGFWLAGRECFFFQMMRLFGLRGVGHFPLRPLIVADTISILGSTSVGCGCSASPGRGGFLSDSCPISSGDRWLDPPRPPTPVSSNRNEFGGIWSPNGFKLAVSSEPHGPIGCTSTSDDVMSVTPTGSLRPDRISDQAREVSSDRK